MKVKDGMNRRNDLIPAVAALFRSEMGHIQRGYLGETFYNVYPCFYLLCGKTRRILSPGLSLSHL